MVNKKLSAEKNCSCWENQIWENCTGVVFRDDIQSHNLLLEVIFTQDNYTLPLFLSLHLLEQGVAVEVLGKKLSH